MVRVTLLYINYKTYQWVSWCHNNLRSVLCQLLSVEWITTLCRLSWDNYMWYITYHCVTTTTISTPSVSESVWFVLCGLHKVKTFSQQGQPNTWNRHFPRLRSPLPWGTKSTLFHRSSIPLGTPPISSCPRTGRRWEPDSRPASRNPLSENRR